MTSSSTILKDNPRMNCRLNGLEINSPIKVILDRFLKVSSKYNIFGRKTFIAAQSCSSQRSLVVRIIIIIIIILFIASSLCYSDLL